MELDYLIMVVWLVCTLYFGWYILGITIAYTSPPRFEFIKTWVRYFVQWKYITDHMGNHPGATAAKRILIPTVGVILADRSLDYWEQSYFFGRNADTYIETQ